MVWTAYNIILTSASLAVASETRQIRSTPRVTVALPAALRFADGRTLMCETDDFSQNGVGLRLQSPVPVEIGTRVDVALFRSEEESAFPATVTFSGNGRLGLQFEDLTLHQQAALSRLTFGRADVWLGFWGNRQHDQPLTSFKSVVVIGVRGLSQVAANLLNILRQAAPVLIVAIAMTFVIVTAGIDLSVGSIVALVNALAAILMAQNIGWFTTIILMLVVGGLIGLVQGWFIAFQRIPAFIVTLAGMSILRGSPPAIRSRSPISRAFSGWDAAICWAFRCRR
jgi:hypothetical protein